MKILLNMNYKKLENFIDYKDSSRFFFILTNNYHIILIFLF